VLLIASFLAETMSAGGAQQKNTNNFSTTAADVSYVRMS